MWPILQIWHLSRQKQTVEQYFQHCLTQVCSRGRAATVEGLYLPCWFQLRAFLKGTNSSTTGKVSWFSKVLAQHIPGLACQPAGGSHPATGPHAAGEWRLLDGGRGASGMGSCWGKQKVWLTAGPDKCHPSPQTDKSATLSVSHRWCNRNQTPPPHNTAAAATTTLLPSPPLCCVCHLPLCWQLCIGQVRPGQWPQSSLFPLLRDFQPPPRLNQLIPACHCHAKIVALCECHLPGQTWAVFNKLCSSFHHPRHPALRCRCELNADVCHAPLSPTAKWGARQPGGVSSARFSSTHITYMLSAHQSGTGRNVFTAVLAHCTSDITPPPCLPE